MAIMAIHTYPGVASRVWININLNLPIYIVPIAHVFHYLNYFSLDIFHDKGQVLQSKERTLDSQYVWMHTKAKVL